MTDREVMISVHDVLNCPHAWSSEDGKRVHARIVTALGAGLPVVVSFAKVDTITPTFMNGVFGRLVGTFGRSELRKWLSVEDMGNQDLACLRSVVENAERYFAELKRREDDS